MIAETKNNLPTTARVIVWIAMLTPNQESAAM